jgi:DNA mismatch repair protein MutS2
MDAETFDLLEYNQVIQIIAGLTQSSIGRRTTESIRPFSNLDQITRQQKALQDTLDFLEENPRIPCSQIEDPARLLDRPPDHPALLTPEELLRILEFLKLSDTIRGFVKAGKLPFLSPELPGLSLPPHLKQAIQQAIGPDGEILDSAHPDLSRTRKQQESLRKKLNDQLRKFFNSHSKYLIPEPFVTQRAGRFVIPVRAENQRQIQGIVHGTSSSGATVFLEPLGSIDLNNQLVSTAEKEAELVAAILRRLSADIYRYSEQLVSLSGIIGRIDSLFACAEFYSRFNCSIPTISEDFSLSLEQACHPLLIQKIGRESVIPISIRLEPENSALAISGPNTGGKTAALKTTGLLSLMALAGLPVPARIACIPMLKGVFADVGDHQSITQQLSTFSSHVIRINELIRLAGYPSLLLLDEPGRGTDPLYGSVLAVSIIDHFLKKGMFVLTTTHHRLVKSYAGSAKGIQNASVNLDPATHRPTYSIEMNSTGHSSGLEIAQQLGLTPIIIEKARSLLDEKELEVESYLELLKEQLRLLELQQKSLTEEKELLRTNERSREKEAQEKEKEREKRFEDNLSQWGNEFRKESKRMIHRISDRIAANEARSKLQKQNEQLKEEFRRKSKAMQKPARQEPIDFSAGDTVFHEFFRKPGTVISVSQNEVTVDIEGKRIASKPDDLSKVGTRSVTRKPIQGVKVQVVESTETELNLIGQRIEDALEKVDKFLDRSVVSQMKEIRIIHGFGTGKLKSSICEFLGGHPQVENFETEGGATRVFLKE